MSALQDLVTLLRSHRFRYADERELQTGIERLLAGNAFEFEREVAIGPLDRLDFLVDPGIAVEVKVARRASREDIGRQLTRYIKHDRVQSLLLVTDRSQLGGIEGRIVTVPNGKKVIVVPLLSGLA